MLLGYGLLLVVSDIAQSDGGINRGAKGKLGIAKTCLGMMLSKMLVRISHGSAHGKVRTRDLARDQREGTDLYRYSTEGNPYVLFTCYFCDSETAMVYNQNLITQFNNKK